MRKSVKKSTAELIPLTRDERLRCQITSQGHIWLSQQLPEEEYQYKLSSLLWRVETTDTGNAIRFVARYGHMCRYMPEPDKWYVWSGQRWIEDILGLYRQFAKKTAAYVEQEADMIPIPIDSSGQPLHYPQVSGGTEEEKRIQGLFVKRDEQREALFKFARKSRSKIGIMAMIDLARDEYGMTVPKEQFDRDDMLLNTKNGVLELMTGKLMTHESNYYMTRICRTEYIPEATCPNWNKFIYKVTCGNQNIARFLRQIAGMGLTGEREEDLFLVFYGVGNNGKTVFQEMLCELLGGYADVAPSEMFMERKSEGGFNDVAGLDGVRLLFKDETKQGKMLDAAMVKEMTGGGRKKARFLFKEWFTFSPKFTPILSTNHRPRINDNDEGIWRRVHEIPWSHSFKNDPDRKPKPQVFTELRAELPGILNWCLAGFWDYKQYGVFMPEEIKMATQAYRDLSDIIGQFLRECAVMEKDAKISKTEMYKAYSQYMEDNGSHPLNKPNFGEQLRERGIAEGKTGAMGHIWKNIRLRQSDELFEEEEEEEKEENGIAVEVF